jgi:hypothetical protein
MDANDPITITLSAGEWEHLCRLLMATVNPTLILINKIQQQASSKAPLANGADAAGDGAHVQN